MSTGGFWRWGWPLLLVGLGVAVPLLVWLGWTVIVNSSDGTSVGGVIDRSAPGFQAFVDPTPTLLLVHGDATALYSLALLTLTDAGVTDTGLTNAGSGGAQTNGSGVAASASDLAGSNLSSADTASDGDGFVADSAVLLIAPETLTDAGLLSDLWVTAGTQGLLDAVADLLGTVPQEIQVVNDAGWQALVSATAPVVLENPDVLTAANGANAGSEVAFASGEIALSAAQVGSYLSWRNAGESPLAALFRQELFWQAWLSQVQTALRGATHGLVIPGETDRAMGRFVPAMVAGRVRVLALPGFLGVGGAVQTDAEATKNLLREIVPFGVATAHEERPRVRVLNGTSDLSLTNAVARVLIRAGAEITVIGNAGELGVSNTQIAYHDAGLADQALLLQQALGVGMVVAQEAIDLELHITVIIGADMVGADFVSNVSAQG